MIFHSKSKTFSYSRNTWLTWLISLGIDAPCSSTIPCSPCTSVHCPSLCCFVAGDQCLFLFGQSISFVVYQVVFLRWNYLSMIWKMHCWLDAYLHDQSILIVWIEYIRHLSSAHWVWDECNDLRRWWRFTPRIELYFPTLSFIPHFKHDVSSSAVLSASFTKIVDKSVELSA